MQKEQEKAGLQLRTEIQTREKELCDPRVAFISQGQTLDSPGEEQRNLVNTSPKRGHRKNKLVPRRAYDF